MNQKQIRAAVEAMLFACGDPIGADKLAQAVQLPQVSVEAALEALREHYTREDSGLCLLGRPVSFRTTDTFLRVFGLSSLADLPPVHGAEAKNDTASKESEG